MCARVQQPLNGWRRARRGSVSAQPVGTAEAGPVAGDVVNVLDCERKAHERPVRRALHLDVGIVAERSKLVVGNDLIHWINPISNSYKVLHMQPTLSNGKICGMASRSYQFKPTGHLLDEMPAPN